ncbi:nuclear transport factor 2 family protein [Rhodoferax sp. GW822-FHT02A01]|uniref:nuclear transport factor 2 family protein n=1 Tax=Rhodoferax sp. GW822-FHT02A01 TaxID=3141537 RepID=UPI00315D9995
MIQSHEIMALEHKRRSAMVDADTDTLSQLFADSMVWIHGTARADSKSGVIASIASGKTVYQAIDCSEETVRIYGDTAIVTGIVHSKLKIANEERQLHNRFSIAWANINRQWQVVNWQSTTVPKVIS